MAVEVKGRDRVARATGILRTGEVRPGSDDFVVRKAWITSWKARWRAETIIVKERIVYVNPGIDYGDPLTITRVTRPV
jgi:hypothetical protein